MVVPRGRPRRRLPPLVIVVCWKWVAADGDERWAGVSDADRAALEIALRLAEAAGDTVTVVTVGEPARRARPARGARRRRRPGRARRRARAASPATPSPAAIAAVAAGATWVRVRRRVGRSRQRVRCRRSSPPSSASPRRSGSSRVEPGAGAGPLASTRRLDGGRREVLDVAAPGRAVGRGRRRPPAPGVAARRAGRPRPRRSSVVPGPTRPGRARRDRTPYRPRPRALAAPTGDALERGAAAHRRRRRRRRPTASVVDARPAGGRRAHPHDARRVGLPASRRASVVPRRGASPSPPAIIVPGHHPQAVRREAQDAERRRLRAVPHRDDRRVVADRRRPVGEASQPAARRRGVRPRTRRRSRPCTCRGSASSSQRQRRHGGQLARPSVTAATWRSSR